MELNVDDLALSFQALLKGLPAALQTAEASLGTLVYFAVNSLAMLRRLDSLGAEKKQALIDWIYSLQVEPPELGGFRSSFCDFTPNHSVEESHLAMAYSYMASLLILGDDLSRVDKARMLEMVKKMQLEDGSFMGHTHNSEADIRYVFCAAAITRMLGDNGGIDVEKAIEYTLNCQTYEGGFAHAPGDEAHGGATYCALASLDLWNALDRIRNKKMLAYWLSQRQDDGFNGRTNKVTDTCYSFWIGASLRVVGWYDEIVDKERLIAFIFSNYCDVGMFRSSPGVEPDTLHTHFSLCGLSLAGYSEVEPIHPALGFVMKGLPKSIIGDKYQ